ncbi:PspA/IM30 family protein [Parasporobacterium paucivorans]|uniref:Phage shock protein A (PspA) family protein n=1 Tax=Parasporobacterium paucivorans DSM 15970 TaxID=1122934 RepID=A0A1M6H9P5_9FIRM|nr:PspA/IM30 family protein [Parasporobacterium paucivorans]SHJ18809.1 phage shock protein A (PspA) family protein [Parasporobacterium paucivorans DSM 15970]
MGILSRFKDIMSSNINALLDTMEDPSKIIDQYLRDLESDLGKVKAETAAVMAEETRAKRELDECSAEVQRMQDYAEKAVKAGNDDDARQFLSKKKLQTDQETSLKHIYEAAAGNAAKMRQMHDKLVADIGSLNARKDSVKAKIAVAKTQERINQMGSSVAGVQGTMSAFDKMEAKADRLLDQANAMTELNESAAKDDVGDLAKKYDTMQTVDVEDELAALKAKLGE